ncbi:hypothetical protein DL98DRAFT_87851 [Cadophora sp. DSE1049]|nr:hypothetical protein DL98DRAFT_87851 [Cadophora sp. DSE1049]
MLKYHINTSSNTTLTLHYKNNTIITLSIYRLVRLCIRGCISIGGSGGITIYFVLSTRRTGIGGWYFIIIEHQHLSIIIILFVILGRR